MKLGCCMSTYGNSEDPFGLRYIPVLKRSGYEYVEMPLSQVTELSDDDFENLVGAIRQSGLPCECCNNFVPASVRLTGNDIDRDKIDRYIKKAIARAWGLGAEIVVFGSGGAKNVPEGFDYDTAFQQIVDALKLAGTYAKERGIHIVIEPLNHKECNIISSLEEGARLMKRVDMDSVGLLVDYYHSAADGESTAEWEKVIPYIEHVHFARPGDRKLPVEPCEEYAEFFRVLKDGGYDGRVSLEAFADDPEMGLADAAMLMRYF